MNRGVICSKIEIIRKTLERIKKHTPASAELLSHNYDAQDIIFLNLERAVQASVDIAAHLISNTHLPPAQTMAESFLCIERAGKIKRVGSKKAVYWEVLSG